MNFNTCEYFAGYKFRIRVCDNHCWVTSERRNIQEKMSSKVFILFAVLCIVATVMAAAVPAKSTTKAVKKAFVSAKTFRKVTSSESSESDSEDSESEEVTKKPVAKVISAGVAVKANTKNKPAVLPVRTTRKLIQKSRD